MHPGEPKGERFASSLERAAASLVDSIQLPAPDRLPYAERIEMAACFCRHAA